MPERAWRNFVGETQRQCGCVHQKVEQRAQAQGINVGARGGEPLERQAQDTHLSQQNLDEVKVHRIGTNVV